MTKFKPAQGLSNGHIQTLFSTFFRKKIDLDFQSEIFELSDGDFVDCYWLNKPPKGSSKPIVILFHGLEGSYKSPYIQGAMNELNKVGYSTVLMHFRGCSPKENRLPRLYHSGDTADAKAFIIYLSNKYTKSKLFAIGYSMGGNMLLKLLGENKENCLLDAAICISVPMQLDISSKTINQGFSKLYQTHLLKHLKSSLLKKYEQFDMESIINLKKEDVSKIETIWEFDHLYTAKMHNFKTAKNYYKQSSSKQYLKDITTPTLIIHALDDPFMTKDILPNKNELSNSITLEIYAHGGHVGFISGTILKPIYWLESRVVEYFEINSKIN